MTKKWLRDRDRDPYHRRAKEEGYRSRAVYKLLQISKKFHLIKKGDTVVDLGAFPGGWIQGARLLVGDEGYVLGIDLKSIAPFEWTNVKTLVGDITRLTVSDILKHLPGIADVVLSDVSPNISGIWEVDHARQIDLARTSFNIATALLRRNGNLVVKAFQGDLLQTLFVKMKPHFRRVKVFKSSASRKRSSEVFIVALGHKLGDE